MGTEAVAMRDNTKERHKDDVRRVVHEFASYAVWHLSLTKPDTVSMRILLNELLQEWADNHYVCGTANCEYCKNEMTTRKFHGMFRRFIGKER